MRAPAGGHGPPYLNFDRPQYTMTAWDREAPRPTEATLATRDANRSGLRRIIGGLVLAAAGVLVVIGWMLGRDLLELAWSSWPGEARRRAAILYLDVLLIGYAVALAVAIGLIAGAAKVIRSRPARVRPLAAGVAILLSLLALDAGAAIWSAWQQRTPSLPEVPPRSGAATNTAAGLTAPESDSAATAGPTAPVPPGALRILVIGESSARGEPYHPWLSVAQIAAWKLESVFPGRPAVVDMWARGARRSGRCTNGWPT